MRSDFCLNSVRNVGEKSTVCNGWLDFLAFLTSRLGRYFFHKKNSKILKTPRGLNGTPKTKFEIPGLRKSHTEREQEIAAARRTANKRSCLLPSDPLLSHNLYIT